MPKQIRIALPHSTGSGPRLSGVVPGGVAVVRRVVGERPEVVQRLQDLGFTPGATVRVLRRAPLGDPAHYRVGSVEICLRRAQASLVEVTEG
ncbi:FeoA family protein [Leifsonia xyli]|uniref:FeoA family protein n=1 Tax=Leifsonia xyli TaxID=1575 RepID=UPI0005C7659D|nr:FeoA family protein [Leifsonia xyli]